MPVQFVVQGFLGNAQCLKHLLNPALVLAQRLLDECFFDKIHLLRQCGRVVGHGCEPNGTHVEQLRTPGAHFDFDNAERQAVIDVHSSWLDEACRPSNKLAINKKTVACSQGQSDLKLTSCPDSKWKLLWSDEFDGPNGAGVDPQKWTHRLGGNGWGNRELQHYTNATENVRQEDGALVIRPKKKMNFGWGKSGKVALTVTVPTLRGAELAGSGDIRIDRVAGDSFDGGIAGSGTLTVGSVEVNRLKMSISGSGNGKAGGGRAKSVEYSIAGSGGIDAKGVAAETASVSIAGSGNVDGQATSTASVNIMGSGNVVMGGPAKCSVTKLGSGSVRCNA